MRLHSIALLGQITVVKITRKDVLKSPWIPSSYPQLRQPLQAGSLLPLFTFHPLSPKDGGGGRETKMAEGICRNLLHHLSLHILIKKNRKKRPDQGRQPYSKILVINIFLMFE